jgi:hypothetical protein
MKTISVNSIPAKASRYQSIFDGVHDFLWVIGLLSAQKERIDPFVIRPQCGGRCFAFLMLDGIMLPCL